MTAPVVTVTLNPAIDMTVVVGGLALGAVNRARGARTDAAGKGVNVAACLADWGVPVAATGVLGADNAAVFEKLFAARGIADGFLRVPGQTRLNIKLTDPAGGTTDVNLPGLPLDAATLAALHRRLRELAVSPETIVVLAGSLPASLPPATYVETLAVLAGLGARAVVDTSGAPLAAVLGAPRAVLPFCVKPNRHELEDWAATALPSPADVLAAARRLGARGIRVVCVSLGADGALFVAGEAALHARLAAPSVVSTVGAGDAMVAGLVAAFREGASLEHAARLATAFAVANLGRVGAGLPDEATVRALAARTEIIALH